MMVEQLLWYENYKELYSPKENESLLCFQNRVKEIKFRNTRELIALVEGNSFTQRGFNNLILGLKQEHSCWRYTGPHGHNGYGILGVGAAGKYRAHRVAFLLWKANWEKDLQVLHTCDVRDCCNPAHLLQGTPKENTFHMMMKGRHKYEVHRKVDVSTVETMKELRELGLSNVKIGERLNLSHETVRSHLNGDIDVNS